MFMDSKERNKDKDKKFKAFSLLVKRLVALIVP